MSTTNPLEISTTKAHKLMDVPLSQIRENSEALRNKVDKTSDKYLSLVASVRKVGILNPISVREVPADPNDPSLGFVYGLVDGLHRYNAALDANLVTIPAQVISVSDGNLLEAQIIANVHKIETTNQQYRKALLHILRQNPLMTKNELASRLSETPAWLDKQLSLLQLNDDIHAMLDEGKLTVTNAYQLSKLPAERQVDLLQQAITMTPAEFIPLSQTVIQELQKAKREGRAAKTDEFTPVARLQKIPAIKSEIECFANKKYESSVLNQIVSPNDTPQEAALKALKWVMHLDELSIKADKANHEARLKQREIEKAQREEKRKAAKEAEAKAAMTTLT